MSSVITIDHVSKSYGECKAVSDLTLSLNAGEILGFLGTNGAGKTTTIKMLLGFFPPDTGQISVFGQNPSDAHTRQRVGFMPETAYYYPYLNIYELLSFYGGLCGMPSALIRQRTEELIVATGLENAGTRLLKTYSKGMLQRAGIAQAILHDPDLLILDEPFTGLDPLARIQLRDLILDLKAKGKTILFSSHELSEAELMCDRIAIMKAGSLVLDKPMTEVAGDGNTNLERIFLNVLKSS
ncbi:MAG: ABC transporter ATP-binding protein [bacterium]